MLTTKDHQNMRLCQSGAEIFGTCSRRKYFAIIVDNKGHILGTGYNGGPSKSVHCEDGGCPRAVSSTAPGSSYDNCIAIHAEANALLHSNYDARSHGGTLYVNGPPCFSCAKLIANSGLKRIVCLSDASYADWDHVKGNLVSWGVEVNIMDSGAV